jgi:hypothetical protein
VVVRQESGWGIVGGGRRFPGGYLRSFAGHGMSRTIAFGSALDAYLDMAAGRELNSVGEEVLEDLNCAE